MEQYCENCGCRMYGNRCTNCDEELFILDQYYELGMEIPSEDTYFMKKVREQQKRLENNTNV